MKFSGFCSLSLFQVAGWFEQLFPTVSYPSNRLSGVLVRILQRAKRMFEEGANLESFLQEPVDLDLVSASLAKLGLKRGQLLGEEGAVRTAQSSEPLTHNAIVDLENFRKREHLHSRFTNRWIRTLSSCITDSDARLTRSVNKIMATYHMLSKDRRRAGDAKLLPFMATPFQVYVAPRKESRPAKPLPSLAAVLATEKMLLKISKENARLREQNSTLATEVAILNDTVHDLSGDLKDMRNAAEENRHLKKEVKQLKVTVTEHKQTIRDLQPRRLQHMKNTIKQLRAQALAGKGVQEKETQTKEDMCRLKSPAHAQDQSLRAVRKNSPQHVALKETNLVLVLQQQNRAIAEVNAHHLEIEPSAKSVLEPPPAEPNTHI